MTAVAGSGIKIMSDSLMPFQPAIDEPSNILPSLKKPSSTRRVGMVTWCSLPIVSVKRRSANFASFSLINFRTSAGVMCVLALGFIWPGGGRGSLALQLMCHCEEYTDQALAIRQQVPLHHNGSNRKNPRPYLVRHGILRRVEGFVHGRSSPYERIRCTVKPKTHQSGVAILAAFASAFAASTRWPTLNLRRPAPFKISFLHCRNTGPSGVASFCSRTTWKWAPEPSTRQRFCAPWEV